MSDFVGAAFGFPTALFSVLLLAVVGYWVVVLVGALDADALDADAGDDDGSGGVLGVVGLGGVPMTVAFSFLIAIGWFVSLAGAALFKGGLASVAVLLVSLGVAWIVTRMLVLGLRRFFVHAPAPSRSDFLGRPCVIRTGSVTPTFGQAEVTASDGSSAIVQVRQSGHDNLRAGTTAYIYGYDETGEYFWVVESPEKPQTPPD